MWSGPTKLISILAKKSKSYGQIRPKTATAWHFQIKYAQYVFNKPTKQHKPSVGINTIHYAWENGSKTIHIVPIADIPVSKVSKYTVASVDGDIML